MPRFARNDGRFVIARRASDVAIHGFELAHDGAAHHATVACNIDSLGVAHELKQTGSGDGDFHGLLLPLGGAGLAAAAW